MINLRILRSGVKSFYSRIIAKIGIPSDKFQKDWMSRLRRERYNFFTNFRSGTPARRQVTLENCEKKVVKKLYLPRRSLDIQSFWNLSLGMPIFAIIREISQYNYCRYRWSQAYQNNRNMKMAGGGVESKVWSSNIEGGRGGCTK